MTTRIVTVSIEANPDRATWTVRCFSTGETLQTHWYEAEADRLSVALQKAADCVRMYGGAELGAQKRPAVIAVHGESCGCPECLVTAAQQERADEVETADDSDWND